MLVGFEKWWAEEGKSADPDTEDVSWFDKREGLAALAFEAGIKCGTARSRNYTADDAIMPKSVTFSNGRTVRVAYNKTPGIHDGVFLEVSAEPPPITERRS